MSVAAVVLAAGTSSRMGSPKQLLKIGDRTLLQTTLEMLQKSAAEEIILVLGHEAERVRNSIALGSTTRLVINPDFHEGMSSSIKAGLAAVSSKATAALIVLADQPLLKASVIDRLIREHQQSGAAIVVPVCKGFRGNPVLIGRALFPEMMQLSGDIGCRSLFGLHPEKLRKVAVDDIGILVDIDTAEDLKKLSEPAIEKLDVSGRRDVFAREIVVIGDDDLVKALTRIAKILQFHVTVVAPLLKRSDLPEADLILSELRIPAVIHEAAIVVASRGKYDEEALEQAVKTEAGYIALMGSKKRAGQLTEGLKARGITDEALRRIHSPAGIAIGAETPEEIALSILAEIVQSTQKRRQEGSTKK